MAGSVVNITVHGIGPACRRLDDGEDGTWVSVAQFERVLDAVAGREDVRITFDDGNASDVDVALPMLLRRQLTAEFFVLAGELGRPGRLDKDAVRELARAGMLIGSHGWAHRDWRTITAGQMSEEFGEARHVLADLTGQRVSRVAIPFGSYDRHVLRRLREAGVSRAYTSDGGRANPRSWLQARTSLRHDLDEGWIHGVLDGRQPLAAHARKQLARAVKRARGRPASGRPLERSR